MADKLPNIAVIGLGLIGSSIICATQYFGAAETVTGFDASKEVLLEAEKIGLPVNLANDIGAAVRDADIMGTLPIGVKALGVHPLKSVKQGVGARSVALRFADADWRAGDYVYADLNGVIIAGRQLH